MWDYTGVLVLTTVFVIVAFIVAIVMAVKFHGERNKCEKELELKEGYAANASGIASLQSGNTVLGGLADYMSNNSIPIPTLNKNTGFSLPQNEQPKRRLDGTLVWPAKHCKIHELDPDARHGDPDFAWSLEGCCFDCVPDIWSPTGRSEFWYTLGQEGETIVNARPCDPRCKNYRRA